MHRYKVIYHDGPGLTLKTKVKSGTLILGEDGVSISGVLSLNIPFASITRVTLFRQHGLGRMIKLYYNDQRLFITVVRFCLFGYFAIVNYYKAGELYEIIRRKTLVPD